MRRPLSVTGDTGTVRPGWPRPACRSRRFDPVGAFAYAAHRVLLPVPGTGRLRL